MGRNRRFAMIPVDRIVTTRSMSRQQHIDRNLEDLAASIELHGILSPVLAVGRNDGTYELVAGQRRMLACRQILRPRHPGQFSEIPAYVYDGLEDWEMTAMSINENFNQEQLTEADKIATVTSCYREFGSARAVSEKTGIPYAAVLRYTGYRRLPAVLQEMYNSGTIPLKSALEAADLFGLDSSDTGDHSKEEIKKAALELEKLSAGQRRNVRRIRHEDRQTSVSDAIDTVRSARPVMMRVTTEVVAKTYTRMEQYREKNGLDTIGTAASELIEEGARKAC